LTSGYQQTDQQALQQQSKNIYRRIKKKENKERKKSAQAIAAALTSTGQSQEQSQWQSTYGFPKWKIPLWFSSKGNAPTVFIQASPLAVIMALRTLPRFSDG
jgi:hypothetical protein